MGFGLNKKILLAFATLTFVFVGCASNVGEETSNDSHEYSQIQGSIGDSEELVGSDLGDQLERDHSDIEAENERLKHEIDMYRIEISHLRDELARLKNILPDYVLPEERSLDDCVEPMNSIVRSRAIALIADEPYCLEANSPVWKIWQINYWVAHNIAYIDDPHGVEYLGYAHETLGIGGGDCDDIAVLMASLYEAVGLDAAIGEIDTDGDDILDHMACLVYCPVDSETFLYQEKMILKWFQYRSPTDSLYIYYFTPKDHHTVLGKYDTGIWIVADLLNARVVDLVGYILIEDGVDYDTYSVLNILDVAN